MTIAVKFTYYINGGTIMNYQNYNDYMRNSNMNTWMNSMGMNQNMTPGMGFD